MLVGRSRGQSTHTVPAPVPSRSTGGCAPAGAAAAHTRTATTPTSRSRGRMTTDSSAAARRRQRALRLGVVTPMANEAGTAVEFVDRVLAACAKLLVRVGDALRRLRQRLARRYARADRSTRSSARRAAGDLGAGVRRRRGCLRPRLPGGARRGLRLDPRDRRRLQPRPRRDRLAARGHARQRLRLRQPVRTRRSQPGNALAAHHQPRRDAPDESRPRDAPDRHDGRLRAVHARRRSSMSSTGASGRAGRSSRRRSRCTAATSGSQRCRFTTTRRATTSAGVRSARRSSTSGGSPAGGSWGRL